MKVDLEALEALFDKCTHSRADLTAIGDSLIIAYPAMRDELIAARKVVEAANWQPDAIDSLKSALREYQDKYGQLPPTGKA